MQIANQHRLWQLDARFMEFMQLRAVGLTPEAMDDEYTRMVAEWLGMDAQPLDWTEDGIAIVTISGPLYKRKSPFASNYRSITEALDTLLAQRPRAAILKVDSPGGVVAGLEPVVRKVNELANQTLVVACVSGVCCSAAYRIASQAGSIVASSDSELGSIGTLWQLMDYSEMFAKEGIKSVLLTTGPFKGIGCVGSPITDEQKAFLQELTDKTNAGFLADVKAARSMDDNELAAVSDGRFWRSEEALGLKLIDQIGSLSDVLSAIRSQTSEDSDMPKATLKPTAQSASTGEALKTSTETETTETTVLNIITSDRTLADYMTAFGDAEGAKMFRDGVAWDTASAQAMTDLRGQLQDAKAENAQLKARCAELGKALQGEGSPLSLSSDAPNPKVSLGQAFRSKKAQKN
jgi:signal peptide peptidase SppA